MVTILLVEDDPALGGLLHEYLTTSGYRVHLAVDGEEALDVLEREPIDLMVTDVMMPRLDGRELTEQLRDAGYTFPILMLTALETLPDKKKGFRAGADDYLVKPVDLEELELRIEAMLRRANIYREHQIQLNDCVLDESSLTVVTPSETIEVAKKEFELLFYLATHLNQVFTRQQLLDRIWGYETESDVRTIDVHINRLRSRLKHVEAFQISTAWGLGYRLELKS
ncbi:response regulator transcription factor [Exiguobacterium sp. SL-9]|uniref:response regulator transcription factor n=1 Tax=Exiguobacterium sp. SL-9 TaxID=2510963 RepID=UPI001039F59B|nr:response regulator transcription factor [Exiguobacterium sp. SL-9]TCI20562.1 response regulator transcription factor [Exiguobacterium sp. SL-9]